MAGTIGVRPTVGRLRWRWVAASTAGALVGVATVFAVFIPLGGPEGIGIPFAVGFPIIIGLVGAILAASQRAAVRGRADLPAVWIAATGVGLAVAMALSLAMGEAEGLVATLVEGALHGAVAGSVLGTSQGWVVRARPGAFRTWLGTSIVCWSIGVAIGDVVGLAFGPLGIVVALAVSSSLTAVALPSVVHDRA